MGMVKKYLSIHAHFYQPPRENPWSGRIYEETKNPIYKNYNDLITDECYGPLSEKNIRLNLDELVSVYSLINFNFGPTLLNYIEKEYPKLYAHIIEADILSKKIFGSNSAIAQVYNHSILPLLPLDKKRLYVSWGIENFKRHFKRKPLGIWLSETAADDETLEVLIENEMEFTILSPTQAKKIKNIKTEEVLEISSYKDLNVSHYYLWKSKEFKNKYIKIFFYDKDISEKMSSELSNPEKYLLRIKSSFEPNERKNKFCLIASDGENYGHHIKKANEYLSKLISKTKTDKEISLQNLSGLSALETEFEVEIKSPSAWSCPHGVGRWSYECGCRINPKNDYQKWRKTLKEVTDKISREADDVFIKNTITLLKDPKQSLLKYPEIHEKQDPHLLLKFVEENSRRNLSTQETISVLKALNSQMDLAFAYTSCGWFFDDITNIETLNNIKRIIKINDYLKENGIDLSDLIEKLKKEKSNIGKDPESEIENIQRFSDYEKIHAAEFALLHRLNFSNPFLKSYYRAKILSCDNDIFSVKITDIRTLEEKVFSVFISEIENPLIRVKLFDQDDKNLINKKDFASFTPLTLSELPEETQKIFKILNSRNEKYSDSKKLLYSLSHFDGSKESFNKLRDSYLKTLKGYSPFEIPLFREITKMLIKISDPNESENKEIISAVLNYGFMGWKVKIYDNKKILS
ncbi:MAG: DUF3536 domain-containing protein [Elusimicrobiales bacterium]|nr:DUF3536 domain-containing protein [Elusimicrobiales bacterium]